MGDACLFGRPGSRGTERDGGGRLAREGREVGTRCAPGKAGGRLQRRAQRRRRTRAVDRDDECARAGIGGRELRVGGGGGQGGIARGGGIAGGGRAERARGVGVVDEEAGVAGTGRRRPGGSHGIRHRARIDQREAGCRGESRHRLNAGRARRGPENGIARASHVGELSERGQSGWRARSGGRRCGARGVTGCPGGCPGCRAEVARRHVGVEWQRGEGCAEAGGDLGREVGVAELQGEARVGQCHQVGQPGDGARGCGGAEYADGGDDCGIHGEHGVRSGHGVERAAQLSTGSRQRCELVGGEQARRPRGRRDRRDDRHGSARRGGRNDEHGPRRDDTLRRRVVGADGVDAGRASREGRRVEADRRRSRCAARDGSERRVREDRLGAGRVSGVALKPRARRRAVAERGRRRRHADGARVHVGEIRVVGRECQGQRTRRRDDACAGGCGCQHDRGGAARVTVRIVGDGGGGEAESDGDDRGERQHSDPRSRERAGRVERAQGHDGIRLLCDPRPHDQVRF